MAQKTVAFVMHKRRQQFSYNTKQQSQAEVKRKWTKGNEIPWQLSWNYWKIL